MDLDKGNFVGGTEKDTDGYSLIPNFKQAIYDTY